MGTVTKLRSISETDEVVEAVAAGRNQPLKRADTLPPKSYISESFYQLETERIFSQEWLCVGHVSQLPSVGDYFPLDLFGELLVVARAADRIRVMSRVCPHRWASLVSEPGNARFFSCPFHKWAFALDGQLLGAPLMERVDFDADDCRLPEYRSEIVDGFIFVNFDDNAAPLADRVTGYCEQTAKYRMDELFPGFVLEYDLPINWKIIVETFMECYHHIAAHPETFERLHPARGCYVQDGDTSWTIGHAPLRSETPDSAVEAGFPILGDLTSGERREFRMYLIYPFHLIASFPDRVGWFRLQPEGPSRTKAQSYLLIRPEAKDDPEYAAKLATEKAFFEKFNSEDIAVNQMQMRGAATRAARVGRLCDLEKAVWQFADYIRGKVDGHA